MRGRDDTGNDARRDERAHYGTDCPGDVTAHSSSAGRVVFTESGNSEGWIATDYTVSVRQ